MKKQNRMQLHLTTETVRALTARPLASVAGGLRPPPDTMGASCVPVCATTTGDSATCYSQQC